MNLQELFDKLTALHHRNNRGAYQNPMLGKTHTEETRAKMKAAHKVKTYKHSAETIASLTAKNKARWPSIMTPKGVFPDSIQVSIAFGINRSTVHRWMQRFPEKFYYVEKKV